MLHDSQCSLSITWLWRTALLICLWLNVTTSYLRAAANDSLRRVIQTTTTKDTNHISALLALALNYNTLSYDTTKKYAIASLNAARSIGWEIGIARAERVIGFAAQRRGFFGEAIQNYTDAIAKFEANDDYSGLGESYNGLGIIMFEQGNYLKSIEYYNRAANYFAQAKNFARVVAPYLNIAYSFLQMNNMRDSAMIYNQRAFIYSKQYNAGGIPFYLINNAIIALDAGNLRMARTLTDSALNHPTASTNVIVLTRAYYFLGLLSLRQDKYDSALAYYHKGLEIAKSSRFLYRIQDGYNYLAEAYRSKKDFARAYTYRDSAVILHDSLLNARTVGQIESLQSTLQQAKITILEEEQKVDAALRNGLIAVVAMVLVLVGFMVYANHQRKKTNEILVEQKAALESANTKLSLLNYQLTEANNYKMRLMSIVAHDLKNPLGGIQLSTEMIQVYLRKGEANINTLMTNTDAILQSVQRMKRFISDMLDMTAAESRNMELHPARFEVCAMILDTIRDFALIARKKKQMIVADLPLHCFVVADHDRLKQVMENIISNALKYSPTNTQIHVIVNISSDNHFICRILDQGPGFKPEDFQRLFLSFQKLSARPTGGESSTGIGLTIAKQITELHGGTITAQNRTDTSNGAEFTLHIPSTEISIAPQRYTTIIPDASLPSMSDSIDTHQSTHSDELSTPHYLNHNMVEHESSSLDDVLAYSKNNHNHDTANKNDHEDINEHAIFAKAEHLAHTLMDMSNHLPAESRGLILDLIDALFFQEYERCLELIRQLLAYDQLSQENIATLREFETIITERQLPILLQATNQIALRITP